MRSAANGFLLTVRGGSTADRAEVWCNRVQPLVGTTRAQRWRLVPYTGEPKNPAYEVNAAFAHLLSDGHAAEVRRRLQAEADREAGLGPAGRAAEEKGGAAGSEPAPAPLSAAEAKAQVERKAMQDRAEARRKAEQKDWALDRAHKEDRAARAAEGETAGGKTEKALAAERAAERKAAARAERRVKRKAAQAAASGPVEAL